MFGFYTLYRIALHIVGCNLRVPGSLMIVCVCVCVCVLVYGGEEIVLGTSPRYKGDSTHFSRKLYVRLGRGGFSYAPVMAWLGS